MASAVDFMSAGSEERISRQLTQSGQGWERPTAIVGGRAAGTMRHLGVELLPWQGVGGAGDAMRC
jgi:hypothetical protein